MLGEVITTTLGLVVGLLTGYYFEWRNSRATRAQNVELETRLQVLRESIYSVSMRDDRAAVQSTGENLEKQLCQWLHDFQGPDGRIRRSRVIERFTSMGFSAPEVVAALTRLDADRQIVLGDEIEVR